MRGGIIDTAQEEKVCAQMTSDDAVRSPTVLDALQEEELVMEVQPGLLGPSSDEELSRETRAKKRKRRLYYQIKISLIRSAPGRCLRSG